MRIALATLKSISPYSPSRHHDTPKLDGELPDAHDLRTWREHLHYDSHEQVFIPPQCFKLAVSEAAKYLNLKIPGEGNSKWTKHFEAGLGVYKPLMLPLKKNDAQGERLFLNADGRRGGKTRVWRRYPIIHEWEGVVEYTILDDKITPELFEIVLDASGKFIGVGRFRPRNNGFYGRFEIVNVKWQ